ncbi:MAG TPA: hypothetical protein V6D11_11520 [Waterburya sp.]|jgi:hypothetical protein
MSAQEQARELAAQDRQHEEHLKETMLNRAEAEVHNPDQDDLTQEQARELAVKERQHEEHLKQSMLNRAKAKINASSDTTDTSAQ